MTRYLVCFVVALLLAIGGLAGNCTSFALPPTESAGPAGDLGVTPTPPAFASPTVQPGTPVTPQTPNAYPYPSTGAGTPSPSVDPRVEIRGSATTLRVGDTLTITSVAVSIGSPRFELYLDNRPAMMAAWDGEVQVPYREGNNPVLEPVSATGKANEARFVLWARAAGTVQAHVFATGAIYYRGMVSGGGMWSDLLSITVTQ